MKLRVIHNVTFLPVPSVNAQNVSPKPRNYADFLVNFGNHLHRRRVMA